MMSVTLHDCNLRKNLNYLLINCIRNLYKFRSTQLYVYIVLTVQGYFSIGTGDTFGGIRGRKLTRDPDFFQVRSSENNGGFAIGQQTIDWGC